MMTVPCGWSFWLLTEKILHIGVCKYIKRLEGFALRKDKTKMAIKRELELETDFAKNYVMNCQDMDEDYKKDLVNLIDLTKMATNGISQEEKIQKITESIAKLALSQIGLIKSIKSTIVKTMKDQNGDIDKRIVQAITVANTKQCE